MRRWLAALTLALLASPAAVRGGDEAARMAGEWKTTMGVLKLTADGDELAGGLVAFDLVVHGRARDGQVTLAYDTKDKVHVEATVTLDPAGRSFAGPARSSGGNQWRWQGWHVDPEAAQGEPGDFAGLWLTDMGLMELARDGDAIKGRYALRGTSAIEGAVTGRHLEGRIRTGPFTGPASFDLDPDGQSFHGAGGTTGQAPWYGWAGRRAGKYARHAPLDAGKLVDGSTAGLLTYAVRAPEGYKEGDGRRWPTVVILHGSNMNAAAYVRTIADAWPDVARDHILLGINGETPSRLDPDDPAFNYTYVSYVGPGKGFPGADRESPGLVREALAELKGVYPVARYYVGGHSQGGFLAYSLMMFSPDLVAGAFPVSAGLLIQAEPGFTTDEAARAAQRAVPLAIVHGTTDPNVDYAMATHALGAFRDAGWPAVRLFDDGRAGHMFALLPVGPAIRWLGAMTGDDPAALAAFAASRLEAGAPRDATAAVRRARGLHPDAATDARLDAVAGAVDARAAPRAQGFVDRMKEAKDASWVDDFLAYRDDYLDADGAAPAIRAFDELRRAQEAPAKKLADEALGLFRRGDRPAGLAKAREVAEKYPASSSYRLAKGWLAERQ